MFGRITIYLDYDTWYIIESGMPFSELYRIAESIPFEKGDVSPLIPETFDNPFKNKSLIIELIDIKEVYQPGQSIPFEILTEGQIPIASHLDVTISDFVGNIIWQSPQSIDVGDPEIGYVDYTWSTEYDFWMPQIHDTGQYTMTASWNDVTVEHKFQIREEIRFSLLQDMIPEYAHQENFLLSFDNDCSKKETNHATALKNMQIDSQQIRDELEKSNLLLNLIFEKQEVWTNDEKRTREYIVPSQIIECIENIKSGNMHLLEKLGQSDEKPEPAYNYYCANLRYYITVMNISRP